MAAPPQPVLSPQAQSPLPKHPENEGCIIVSVLCIFIVGVLATYFSWSELGPSALGIGGGALVLVIALMLCARHQRNHSVEGLIFGRTPPTALTRAEERKQWNQKLLQMTSEEIFQHINNNIRVGVIMHAPFKTSLELPAATAVIERLRGLHPEVIVTYNAQTKEMGWYQRPPQQ